MRSKRKISDSGPGWQFVFSSLSTILITFFCMLCAYSYNEKGRMIEITRSFKGALTRLPKGVSPDLGVKVTVPPEAKSVENISSAEISYQGAADSLKNQLREAGAKEDFSVEPTQEGLCITLNDTLLFDSGMAELKYPSQIFIDIVANTVKKSPVKAVITGHTDNQPMHTELYPSNWELSTMRAVNLLRYMHDQFHIPLDRMEACGAGEFRPKNDNRSPEDRAKNRRVEIMLYPLKVENRG
jgi:chemotaxis protein MotB